MKGFILAAGEGTRLRPLTYEIPKPLITVGKIPILSYLIDLFLENGIEDIKIVILKAHIQDFYRWKATYYPRIRIEFVPKVKSSGTFTPVAKYLDGPWLNRSYQKKTKQHKL